MIIRNALSFHYVKACNAKGVTMDNYGASTVAAISTPHGKGGIAVLRVSGEKAIEIAGKVFKPLSRSLSECEANRAVYGNIFLDGEKIDDGIATVFRGPKSFTGEDTVEISCHGSEIGASMVLSALLSAGALPAEAGEFTKRAFLSGKVSLSQAEAIGELIDAESKAGARLSAAKLTGVLGDKISGISQKIVEVLSSVYAYIDYPDEDIADMSGEEMQTACSEILYEVTRLADTYDSGRAISKGIPTAIVGSPNVGKSSLLNLFLGTDRAIVTDIAGTTRDVITESASVGNIRLLLSDTAGIRETEDVVEKIGVERSKKELAESELVLAIFDTSRTPDNYDRDIISVLSEYKETKRIIVILNKCDSDGYSEAYRELTDGLSDNTVLFSVKNGSGRKELEEVLFRLYPSSDEQIRSGLIVTGARQYASLKNAESSLTSALEALRTLTPDMCCAELEAAARSLMEIDGRSVNEKIIDGIFSRFCVGK